MDRVESAQPVPEGYRELRFAAESFNSLVGPLYIKRDGEKSLMGFRIEQRHCNPAGIAHGGMLMTVADMCAGLGTSLQAKIGKFLPTVNMTFDFVAPGQRGDWVEGRTDIIRIARTLAFVNVMLTVEGTPILRASAIIKIPTGEGWAFDRAKLIKED